MKMRAPIKCKRCGDEFVPRSSRQYLCGKPITMKCAVCGDEFETTCSTKMTYTCSKPECKKIAGNVGAPKERVCKNCGEKFVTTKTRQVYCNKTKEKQCPSCGKVFSYTCGDYVPVVCGDIHCQSEFIVNKRRSAVAEEVRICKWCGKEFHPKEVMDVYCYDTHYKNCVVCNKQFEVDVRSDPYVMTCSKECKYIYASQQHDYAKGMENCRKSLMEKYGVDNVAAIPGVQEKMKATSRAKYGCDWYTQTEAYRESVKQSSLEKYGVDHFLKSPELREKMIEGVRKKYGVDNVFQSVQIKERTKQTLVKKYGSEYVSQIAEFKSKATKNARKSKLEQRICALLDNYEIEYVQHYFIKQDNHSHEFDFFIPKYKLLVDADGLYYHSYLDDPDGVRVREDYDEVRLYLVPPDCIFHVIVEQTEDAELKELLTTLESMDGDLSKYDSILFKWCRSIDFPYPEYTEKRMKSDWLHLQRYCNNAYVPQCRIGQSIIKHFHKSIYHCKVGYCKSPFDGWNDDDILKRVIRNRLIYMNNIDPSKILAGFTISKLSPCVSTFNPILARYLTLKYLSEFNSVFDPFSGFSGRLLGVASTGKQYIGRDLNKIAVAESNSIINFLQLDCSSYSITCQDVLLSEGEFSCMLTCPPYSSKEIYNTEKVFKTCDEWITECISRFKCSRYVFVVDNTDRYVKFVKESITSQSHLNKVFEYVVVIDREKSA